MAKKTKDSTLSLEERLEQALIPNWDEPYKLPENWCWTTLNQISANISDGSHNPPQNSGKGVPLLSAMNIYDHKIDINSAVRWITEEQWIEENKRTKIEPNDVLLTIVGTIGRTAVVETEKFALQRSVAVIKPKINSYFLSYYFETPYVQTFLQDNAKGTAQKGFYLNALQRLYCSIPPLAEQERIVTLIENLFKKLNEAKEKAQEVVNGFETRKVAILYKAFLGELTAKWRAEKQMYDNDYCEKSIGELFTHATGKALKKGNTTGSLRKYITTSNVYWGKFDFSEIREMYFTENELEKCTAKKGDLLICNGGDVGRAAIWIYDYDICLQNHISKLRPKQNDVDVKFIYYYFMNSKMRGAINGKGIGISSLSAKDLLSMKVMLPPLSEQQKIVETLDTLISNEEKAKETAEAVIEQIDTIKKAILARAFCGELGTNDPSEESAVELLKRVL